MKLKKLFNKFWNIFQTHQTHLTQIWSKLIKYLDECPFSKFTQRVSHKQPNGCMQLILYTCHLPPAAAATGKKRLSYMFIMKNFFLWCLFLTFIILKLLFLGTKLVKPFLDKRPLYKLNTENESISNIV